MAGFNALPYRRLDAELYAFLDKPQEPSAGAGLALLLRELRGELANPDPLGHAPPDPRARSEIQSGRTEFMGEVLPVSPDVQRELLSLSDDLGLDERVCLQLWAAVSRKAVQHELELTLGYQRGFLGANLPLAARRLWLVEQSARLKSVTLLLKVLLEPALTPEKHALVAETTRRLVLDGGLAANLMRCIERLIAMSPGGAAAAGGTAVTAAKNVLGWPVAATAAELAAAATGEAPSGEMAALLAQFYDESRTNAAECLFYVFYSYSASAVEARQLAELLRHCSDALAVAAEGALADACAAR
ncbi:unnamed protein product, partial [Phaeothamnion confervicola]